MNERISPSALRAVPELNYLNAINVARYRAIMRYMYLEYQRLKYWLKPEEIYEGVQTWGILDGYTLDLCLSDLEQLKSWGNLASRHDGGRALSLEEYMRKKSQYLLTPYAIEIERMLESLEKVKGYGGSLETSYFDTIAACVRQVRENTGRMDEGESLRNWELLYGAFKTMHENAADFIASLNSMQAEEMMATDGFLAMKENLVNYLQHFVKSLQRNAYRIEGQLLKITNPHIELYLTHVTEDELSKPRLEEAKSGEETLLELRQGWRNLMRWFVGDEAGQSELTLLEKAAKETIAKVVRSAVRLQERRRGGASRRLDLETVARRFAELDSLEEAHRLGAYVFGLFPSRHLQGEDRRETERSDASTWDEPPNIRLIRSRSRRRAVRGASEPMRNQSAKREAYREQVQEMLAEEQAFVDRMLAYGSVSISELAPMNGKERMRLLQWIGRCTAAASRTFVTADGCIVAVRSPAAGETGVLRCNDGELVMPDYRIEVTRGVLAGG
ncbi:TIGR02677 family protein [Cohnella nanjingensis]|uniref:TIGR02677 family protein n=1 Tax=Cohnella nanjingensis TaxID=1387779 RepID=A0A7X0VFL4_9BACL|nr:TIGR02677 family protein [Cohnella nanjingensis]MBB6672190.1 TIGR02677 family protein [Cohnella nanjingensis]